MSGEKMKYKTNKYTEMNLYFNIKGTYANYTDRIICAHITALNRKKNWGRVNISVSDAIVRLRVLFTYFFFSTSDR